MQYLKFWWPYSNQTWIVSSSILRVPGSSLASHAPGVGRGNNVGLRDFCHILTLLSAGASMFHKHMSSSVYRKSKMVVLANPPKKWNIVLRCTICGPLGLLFLQKVYCSFKHILGVRILRPTFIWHGSNCRILYIFIFDDRSFQMWPFRLGAFFNFLAILHVTNATDLRPVPFKFFVVNFRTRIILLVVKGWKKLIYLVSAQCVGYPKVGFATMCSKRLSHPARH